MSITILTAKSTPCSAATVFAKGLAKTLPAAPGVVGRGPGMVGTGCGGTGVGVASLAGGGGGAAAWSSGGW